MKTFVSRAGRTLSLAFVVTLFAGSCDEDSTVSNAGDANVDATMVDGPTAAPFGLDVRPSNTACVAPSRPSSASPVQMTQVFPNLTLVAPMAMAQIPGDSSRFFVAQRDGTIVSFSAANPSNVTKVTVLNTPKPVNQAGEGGFLGFAFHPDFLHNGKLFFSYTSTGGATGMNSIVATMASTDGGASFAASTYYELLSFDQPFVNHKGGDVHFGKDGYLYLSFGDGGSQGDPLFHGQNTNLFFSKILRIDVDNVPLGQSYGIPPTNPFVLGGGEPATFAYGFRNPYRFSIDPVSGQLSVGDVGQDTWEEIDLDVKAGGNYGWSAREGSNCYSPSTNCATAGLIDPIYNYKHLNGDACIIGGIVYRGQAILSIVGTYIFADFASARVWTLTVDNQNKPQVTEIPNGGGGAGYWSSFAVDNSGEVYLIGLGGFVYKLVTTTEEQPSSFPQKLSQTGCTSPNDSTKPASGLVPFEPVSPLWSDGASKERYMALPDGTTIAVQPDGDFEFPIGTVMLKTFLLNGKRIETRLFVRHSDGGWAGYSYEWNDAETDATLLPASKSKFVAGQTWYFPSRPECMRCHTPAANFTLGPEIGQLNSDFLYKQTNRVSNQLATLQHIGMFSSPISNPSQLVQYVNPAAAQAPLDGRTRSYLHANCSMCHRPSGGTGSNMDFRFSVSLDLMNACGAIPQDGDLGIPGARIIDPGSPLTSLVVQRPLHLDTQRMPPIATNIVDLDGIGVVAGWVGALSSCPASLDAGGD